MSYVHTVVNALTLPAMPDMKPAISAVMPSPSKPGPAITREHQGKDVVVAVQSHRGGGGFTGELHRQYGQAEQTGQDDDESVRTFSIPRR